MSVPAGNVSELFVSFQGEGLHAGRRQVFVRFGGCPLRCRYCDTPASLVPGATCRILGPDGERGRPNPLTVPELARELGVLMASAPPLHAVAVTGGEPLSQVDFVHAWLETTSPGLPILLETAGIFPTRLRRLLPLVAIVSLDFKCPSNTGERPRWDEHDACLRAAVEAGREVYVKLPVDATTDPAEVERGARIVAAIDPHVPVFLTPLTEPATPRFTIDTHELVHLQAVASAHVADVRVLPQLHKVLGIP